MGRWSDVDVLRASREWVSPWFPPTATRVSHDGYELYLDGTAATVMAANGARPALDDVAAILDIGRRVGAETVEFTLEPDDSGAPPADVGVAQATAEVARLWGAAVIPSARGRGAYRVLVAVRAADARARGGTLGLVHALATTSSSILRRLGFRKVGEQRIFRASIAP